MGTRMGYAEVPLAVGNVISNEPGYYEDGNFGIRIENIIMVKEVETTHMFGDKPFLGFEHVTMVPYCRTLIDEKLLTQNERHWINEYHANVFSKVEKYFEKGTFAREWLEREVEPL